jgi:hypothetical protein
MQESTVGIKECKRATEGAESYLSHAFGALRTRKKCNSQFIKQFQYPYIHSP